MVKKRWDVSVQTPLLKDNKWAMELEVSEDGRSLRLYDEGGDWFLTIAMPVTINLVAIEALTRTRSTS